MRHAKRENKTQSEETKQALVPNSDLNQNQEFQSECRATIISMLRALMEKVDNMQEQIDNISKDMEILRNDQKEVLEIKNSKREMKNDFDQLPGD